MISSSTLHKEIFHFSLFWLSCQSVDVLHCDVCKRQKDFFYSLFHIMHNFICFSHVTPRCLLFRLMVTKLTTAVYTKAVPVWTDAYHFSMWLIRSPSNHCIAMLWAVTAEYPSCFLDRCDCTEGHAAERLLVSITAEWKVLRTMGKGLASCQVQPTDFVWWPLF